MITVRPRLIQTGSNLIACDQVGCTDSANSSEKATENAFEFYSADVPAVRSKFAYARFAEPVEVGDYVLHIEDVIGEVFGSGIVLPVEQFSIDWIEDSDLDLSAIDHTDFAGLTLTSSAACEIELGSVRNVGSGDCGGDYTAPFFGAYLHRCAGAAGTPAHGIVIYPTTTPSNERAWMKTQKAANYFQGVFLGRLPT